MHRISRICGVTHRELAEYAGMRIGKNMTETLGEAIGAATTDVEVANTNPDTVTEQVSAENEPVTEVVETKPEESQESVETEQVNATEESKTPASVNKRLNKMYAEKRQAEEKATAETRRALELEQELIRMRGGAQQSFNLDPYAPKEPNESDQKYATNQKAYIKDYVQYERDVLIYQSQRNQVQQRQTQLMQEHNKRILQAHERYPDYEEKIANLDTISTPPNSQIVAVLSSTLMGLTNSADVMYYLGDNLEECADLLKKDPYSAAASLGRISAKLERNGEPQKPSAPPPPRKIKGQGSTSVPNNWNTISVDDLAKKLRRTF